MSAGRAGRDGVLVTVALVALLAVVAGGLSALAATRSSHRHALDRARTQAIAAATREVGIVLSYDYRHLQSDFRRAESMLTSGPKGFRAKYVRTTAKQVQPLAAKYHAVSTAEVSAAGVVDNNADRAVVLVFVSQTATNTQLAQPRLDRSRIRATLVRVGDRWLIDRLDPV